MPESSTADLQQFQQQSHLCLCGLAVCLQTSAQRFIRRGYFTEYASEKTKLHIQKSEILWSFQSEQHTLLVMHVTYRFPWSSKQSPDGRARFSRSPQNGLSDMSSPTQPAA